MSERDEDEQREYEAGPVTYSLEDVAAVFGIDLDELRDNNL